MERQKLTLATIKDGVANAMFDHAQDGVFENIADVNTDWKAKRKITIEIEYQGDEERQVADVLITVSSKLPSRKPQATRIYFAKRGGKFIAQEHDPKQLEILAPAPPVEFPRAAEATAPTE